MVKKLPKGPTLYLKLKDGTVVCRLFQEIAPKHVERIRELVDSGSYNNVVFHRVIEGFMAQTGDILFGNKKKNYVPESCGTGGSEKANLTQEFSDVPLERIRTDFSKFYPKLSMLKQGGDFDSEVDIEVS